MVSSNVRYGAIGDFTEYYCYTAQKRGVFTAGLWLLSQIARILPSFTLDSIYRSLAMFNNYLKIALRTIKKHKGYSFINIAGLGIGIACCILIFLYVLEETSYDNYHEDIDRIFRIATVFKTETWEGTIAAVGPAFSPLLIKDFPQVEHAARLYWRTNPLVKKDNIMFYEKQFFYADNSMFSIFTIPFVFGDSGTALLRPHTVVISRRIARKYFGNENPLGKTLNINSNECEITAVLENPPANTHIKYDIVVSMVTLGQSRNLNENWGWTNFNTYVKLKDTVNSSEFEILIRRFEDNYYSAEQIEQRGFTNTYFLQPLQQIHLHSNYFRETESPGNPVYVIMTAVVGFFILALACINFMNLTTAKFANRAKEIGLRKVVGAHRTQLVFQFLGESLLMSSIAFIFAFLVAGTALPLFNNLSGETFILRNIIETKTLATSAVLMIFTGLAAGFYPALLLSQFRPGAVLKSRRGASAGNPLLRKILVVGQFTISIALLTGTMIVYNQINYMKTKELGFEKEQKLFFTLGDNSSRDFDYNTLKSEFIRLPGVSEASVSSGIPGYGYTSYQTSIDSDSDNKTQLVYLLFTDTDLIPQFKIKMVEGRPFMEELGTDMNTTFVINETAAQAFGWQKPSEALGMRLRNSFLTGTVIGVVKDFHYANVQEKIGPLAFIYMPDQFRTMSLTVSTVNLKDNLSGIENKYNELFPGQLFSYQFVDEVFDNAYKSEERTGRLFSTFTFLGIFISCLGLLGLSSYTAERRTREVGIRKVLGASILEVTVLLQREFIKWVTAAVIIAVPVSYFLMNKWLQSFAYRISIDIWVFVSASITVLAIALAAVSFQTVKAAASNPVKALRYE